MSVKPWGYGAEEEEEEEEEDDEEECSVDPLAPAAPVVADADGGSAVWVWVLEEDEGQGRMWSCGVGPRQGKRRRTPVMVLVLC